MSSILSEYDSIIESFKKNNLIDEETYQIARTFGIGDLLECESREKHMSRYLSLVSSGLSKKQQIGLNTVIAMCGSGCNSPEKFKEMYKIVEAYLENPGEEELKAFKDKSDECLNTLQIV
jgi:hypothetical protein